MNQIDQEQFFAETNFEKYDMEYPCGKYTCYKAPSGHFYRIDHFSDVLVVEYAENEEEARANRFEDGTLIPDDLPDDELMKKIWSSMT